MQQQHRQVLDNHTDNSGMSDRYPSRKNREEKIIQRLDPVIYGETESKRPYALNSEQLTDYERNGFLILPAYMEDWVDTLLGELGDLRKKMTGKAELVVEPDSKEVRSIFAPNQYSPLIDRFSRHPKILNIVRQILDSDVYISQSRINIKPALIGRSFSWHSDFETWHVEDGMPGMRAVTAWIMLTENTEHNGPLYVIPGSHKTYVSCTGKTKKNNHLYSLKKQVAGVPEPQTLAYMMQRYGIKGIYGKPGTVVFHECNLMHGSPDNLSHIPRTLLMNVYNSCENSFVQPFGDQPPRPSFLRNPDPSPLQAEV
jgi:ectoine hydroxylase